MVQVLLLVLILVLLLVQVVNLLQVPLLGARFQVNLVINLSLV